MQIEFSGDELILAMVSLVRAIDPGMLRQGPDGFILDTDPLDTKTSLTPAEELLLRLRAATTQAEDAATQSIELSRADGLRLAEALGLLESLQRWPDDVLAVSRSLRARLQRIP